MPTSAVCVCVCMCESRYYTHTRLTRISPGLQQLLHERYQEVEQTRTTEHVHEKLSIQLEHFPEDNVELLSEVDLLNGVREIGVAQWIHEKVCYTLSNQLKVLEHKTQSL